LHRSRSLLALATRVADAQENDVAGTNGDSLARFGSIEVFRQDAESRFEPITADDSGMSSSTPRDVTPVGASVMANETAPACE
jgi:hypothetical protein